MISLTINGKPVDVPEGSTVLQAAEKAGIKIPTLCFHKDLTPYGSCRLCVVEVEGARLPATSCDLLAAPGMMIRTESDKLARHRRAVLKTMLYTFYDAGYKKSNGSINLDSDTEFANLVKSYGIDIKSAMAKQPRYPIDSDPNPFIWVDMNKCILCTRCMRACAEVQGRFVWAQAYRGSDLRIIAGADSTVLQARCESCGACVAYCPTGALDNKISVILGSPDRQVATTCSYCGVGCQFDLNVKEDRPGGRVIRVTSNLGAPVNGMHLCVKGRYGYDFIHRSDRLVRPRVREYLLTGSNRPENRGPWAEVDWDTALNIAASGLRKTRDDFGPDSIGVLTSGRLLNEELYLLNKLVRQALGTNNIDNSAHLDHASIFDDLIPSFGSGAMTNTLEDIANKARSLLVIGSDITEHHPVFGAKIRQAVLRRGLKLVVADPYPTNIAEYAELQLRFTPGTETDLINGLIKVILDKGWEDHNFIKERTEGFEAFRSFISSRSASLIAETAGIPLEDLVRAAEILATNRPAAVICGTGNCQYSMERRAFVNLANLQMLLGNLGTPGGGLNPLSSRCNDQGACDMGALPGFYPGYQAITSTEARQKFATAWGTGLPEAEGMTAGAMAAAAEGGQLKALYILNEDLALAASGSRSHRRSLEACNFVILEEVFLSETTRFADVLLPGVSFAEKTGTFTNTERRIQMVRQAIEPLGESRPDWQIIAELARRILAGDERRIDPGPYAGWDFCDSSQIMAEIAALTPVYAGVSHERLERRENLHWPVESPEHPGTPVLHTGTFIRGRGQFRPVEFVLHGELHKM